MPTRKTSTDKVPSSFGKDFLPAFEEALNNQEFVRERMKTIIGEYVETVDFMRKVKGYASEEIDTKLFSSFRYYLTAGITALVVLLIGFIFNKFVH